MTGIDGGMEAISPIDRRPIFQLFLLLNQLIRLGFILARKARELRQHVAQGTLSGAPGNGLRIVNSRLHASHAPIPELKRSFRHKLK